MSLQPINSPTTWKRAQTSINANFTALVNALAGEGTVDATDPAVTALLTDSGSGAYAAVEGIVEAVTPDVMADVAVDDASDFMAALTRTGKRPVGQGELVINVKDAPYNAKGDGSTDDTAAIQAALDAADGGRGVYLPAGTYILNSEIVTKFTGCAISGEGERSILRLGHADACLRVDTFRVRLSNFRVDGQHTANYGVVFSNGARASGRNVRVYDCELDGWLVDPNWGTGGGNCNFIVLNHCESASNTRHGYHVADNAGPTNSTNFTLADCEASTNGGHGALLRDSLPQVRGGMFISNGGYGIQLGELGDDLATTGANIDHPRLEGNSAGTFNEGNGTQSLIRLYDSYVATGYAVAEEGNNWRVGYRGTYGGFTVEASNGSRWTFRRSDGSLRTRLDTSLWLGTVTINTGSATPEGAVQALKGSLYLRRGADGPALYVKSSGTSGSGTTDGWVPAGTIRPYRSSGTSTSLTNEDYAISGFGNPTFTLPAASAAGAGREYVIKNTGTGTTTVVVSGGGTIDGSSSLSLATQYESVRVISNGSNWLVI